MYEYHAMIASLPTWSLAAFSCARDMWHPLRTRSLCLALSARTNCAANSASKSAGRAFSRPVGPQKT